MVGLSKVPGVGALDLKFGPEKDPGDLSRPKSWDGGGGDSPAKSGVVWRFWTGKDPSDPMKY